MELSKVFEQIPSISHGDTEKIQERHGFLLISPILIGHQICGTFLIQTAVRVLLRDTTRLARV
jgi:hypothetical protein